MTIFTALGAHIVDVLGRPVAEIPTGQGGAVLDEIRMTVAGTAGGTAVDLARLGGEVRSIGAIGGDNLARFLLAELASVGVDCGGLVVRDNHQTSATILPIRANGERPALHVPGATGTLHPHDVSVEVLRESDFLHVGGPDVLGDFALRTLPGLLAALGGDRPVVSCDLLSTLWPGALEALVPVFRQVGHLLINDAQAATLTGDRDPVAAATALRSLGPQVVVVTTGAEGGVLVDEAGLFEFDALAVPVVDTTGCGDAFSAGYLRALSLGWPPRRACALGTACAATVATVLGSDGLRDLPSMVTLAGTIGG